MLLEHLPCAKDHALHFTSFELYCVKNPYLLWALLCYCIHTSFDLYCVIASIPHLTTHKEGITWAPLNRQSLSLASTWNYVHVIWKMMTGSRSDGWKEGGNSIQADTIQLTSAVVSSCPPVCRVPAFLTLGLRKAHRHHLSPMSRVPMCEYWAGSCTHTGTESSTCPPEVLSTVKPAEAWAELFINSSSWKREEAKRMWGSGCTRGIP